MNNASRQTPKLSSQRLDFLDSSPQLSQRQIYRQNLLKEQLDPHLMTDQELIESTNGFQNQMHPDLVVATKKDLEPTQSSGNMYNFGSPKQSNGIEKSLRGIERINQELKLEKSKTDMKLSKRAPSGSSKLQNSKLLQQLEEYEKARTPQRKRE